MAMAKTDKGLIRSLNRSGTRTNKLRAGEVRGGRLQEPAVCEHCGALYRRRVWRRTAVPTPAVLGRSRWTRCPACVQTGRQEYLGRVLLSGHYLRAHGDAVQARINNVVTRAGTRQPQRRVVSVEARDGALEVLTTSQKLAHRIAHEMKKAFGGRTSYAWADDGLLTARWERS